MTKIRVSSVPIIDTAPLHAAMTKGFFAEQGLDVDNSPSVGGATGLPAVAGGHVQIASSNIVSIILGVDQGLDFQMIGVMSASTDAPPNSSGLVSKTGSGYKTGKDLEGKRVAVNARNNINWLMLREWAALTGGNPDRMIMLEAPFPQMLDPVRGGQFDAAFMVDPFLSAGTRSGAIELVSWPYDVFKRLPTAQYVASRRFIESNPGVIDRWVRAYNKGVDWVNQNKGSDEWVKLIAGYTRLTPEQVKGGVTPVWEKTVDPAAVQKMAGLMRKHGLLDRNIDVKSLLHRTALEGFK